MLGAIALAWVSPPGAAAIQGEWEPVETVSSPTQYGIPKFATEPGGDAQIVWYSGLERNLMGAVRDTAGSLSSPAQFASLPGGKSPSGLLIGEDQTAVIPFESDAGVKVRPPGGEFGPFENVPVPPTSQSLYNSGVRFAVSPDGSVAAVWTLNLREARMSGHLPIWRVVRSWVQVSVRPPNGSFGAPKTISSDTSIVSFRPAVGYDSEGLLTVAWARSFGDGSLAAETTTSTDGNTFSGPATVPGSAGAWNLPKLVISRDDEATLFWQTYEYDSNEVWASTREPGGSFGAATKIGSGKANGEINVAVGPSGTVAATWVEQKDDSDALWAVVRQPGQEFSAAAVITETDLIEAPKVGIDADGAVTVAFSEGGGYDRLLTTSVQPAGGTFSEPSSVPGTSQAATTFTLLVNPDGSAIVGFLTQSTDSADVSNLSIRPAGGTFSDPVVLTELDQVSDPTVSMGRMNQTIAAWIADTPGRGPRVQAGYGRGGSFSGAYYLTAPGAVPDPPVVASGPEQNGAVAWTDRQGSDATIGLAVQYPSIGGFNSPPLELSEPGVDYLHPQIGFDSQSEITMSWLAKDGPVGTVMAATMPLWGPLDEPFTVSDPGEIVDGPPAMATAEKGTAVITWLSKNSQGLGEVRASFRGTSGEFSRPVTVWSSSTGQTPASPTVAMSAAGAATVAWGVTEGGRSTVRAASADLDGVFGSSVEVGLTSDADSISVGANPAGTSTIVWSDVPSGDTPSVFTATGNGPDGYGQATKLSTPGTSASSPRISIGPDGTATVAWDEDSKVTTATREPGEEFGQATALPNASQMRSPEVAVGPLGRAVVIGQSPAGGRINGAWADGFQVPGPDPDPDPDPPACQAAMKFRSFTKNKRRGRGSLTVQTNGKGRVTLKASRQVKGASAEVRGNGRGRLLVKVKGGAARKLERRGRVKVAVRVTFRPNPACGTVTKARKLTLVKRGAKRR